MNPLLNKTCPKCGSRGLKVKGRYLEPDKLSTRIACTNQSCGTYSAFYEDKSPLQIYENWQKDYMNQDELREYQSPSKKSTDVDATKELFT